MSAHQRVNTHRVVLLGKTGAGKSSLGNSLLGQDEFRVECGLRSGTQKCQWADVSIDGLQLEVIDTPGLCDTHLEDKVVLKEIAKSVALAAPGPHIILMVLRCDRRFTAEEHYAYTTLKKLFGEDIKKYMIVVFCGKDALGHTEEEQERRLAQATEGTGKLQEVLSDAGGRYFAINNRAAMQDRKKQAKKLISLMEDLRKSNGGRYFSNTLCKQVGTFVEESVQHRMNTGNTTHDEAERETKQNIADDKMDPNFWKKVVEVVSLVLKVALGIVQIVGAAKGVNVGGAGVGGGGGELGKCSVM